MKRTELMMLVLGLFIFCPGSASRLDTGQEVNLECRGLRNPAVAVDSTGGLHVVWRDKTPGKGEIYYKRSTDGGVTWTANKRLTWNSRWASCPTIAADTSGSLHVFWNTS